MEVHQRYNEYRCKGCDKLMFKAVLIDSEVEVKCKRCGQMNTFKGGAKDKYVCYIEPCPNRIAVKTK